MIFFYATTTTTNYHPLPFLETALHTLVVFVTAIFASIWDINLCKIHLQISQKKKKDEKAAIIIFAIACIYVCIYMDDDQTADSDTSLHYRENVKISDNS